MRRFLAVVVLVVSLMSAGAANASVDVGDGWYLIGHFNNPVFGSGAITQGTAVRAGGISTTVRYLIAPTGIAALGSGDYGYMSVPGAGGNLWTPSTALPSTIATNVATGYGYIGCASFLQGLNEPADVPDDWKLIHQAINIGVTTFTAGGVNYGRGFGVNRAGATNYSSYDWQRINPASEILLEEAYDQKVGSSIACHVMFAAVYDAELGYWLWRLQSKDAIRLNPEGAPEGFYQSVEGTGTWPALTYQFGIPTYYQQVKYPTITGAADLGASDDEASIPVNLTGNAGIYQTMEADAALELYNSMGSAMAVSNMGLVPPVDRPDAVDSEEGTATPIPGWAWTWYENEVQSRVNPVLEVIAGFLWPIQELSEL